MFRAFVFLMIFLAGFCLQAQSIRFVCDDKIMQKLENQKVSNSLDTKHNGFRYQIFQGTSRNDAYAINANFLTAFPDMPSYVLYEPPNFKVRVGDFHFKFEALAFKKEMVEKGITNFYIVHDKINVAKPQ